MYCDCSTLRFALRRQLLGAGPTVDIRCERTRGGLNRRDEGGFEGVEWVEDEHFGFSIPTSCPDVPSELLLPRNTWKDPKKYDRVKQKLIGLFQENFEQFKAQVHPDIVEAGPVKMASV